MLAALFAALFEFLGELIFVTLGTKRTLALLSVCIAVIVLTNGKPESGLIFFLVAVVLMIWDVIARRRGQTS